MKHWYFSKDEDPNVRPYEPADARSVQPDHYPNILRPGGGYPEGRREDKSDARCNKCKDPLEHGYCKRCDWGLQSTSEPINNYPVDPFDDERAGIRAASWKFGSIKEAIWQILEEDRSKNEDGIARITNQEISERLADLGIEYTAKQVQNRINYFKFRTAEEKDYQLQLRSEKYKEKNALSSFVQSDPNVKREIDTWIEAEDEYGFQKYSTNKIIQMIASQFGKKFDTKILNKYIELNQLKRPPMLENPYGKVQPEQQSVLFNLANQAAQSETPIYGPIDLARKMKDLTGLNLSSTAIRYWIDKWQQEGKLPTTLQTAGGGGYDASANMEGYVYVNQGPDIIKIGITNYLEDRMDAYRRQNIRRQPGEEGLIYNLSPEFTNDAPGQIVKGPMPAAAAKQIEQALLSWTRSMGLQGVEEVGHGWTETSVSFPMPEHHWELMNYIIDQMVANQPIDKNYIKSLFNYDPAALEFYFNNQFGKSIGFIESDFVPDQSAPEGFVGETIIAPGDPGKFAHSNTSSYEGWSNWETWNTKLMIDNEYEPYMQSRKIVEERRPIEQFAEWATQVIIAPHNQKAIADAQEWNAIPYEERPTGQEDMPEGTRDFIEGIEEIFDMDSRADETARIIDESKVNWNEIYNSIGEDIKESELYAHQNGEHELPSAEYVEFMPEELAQAKAEAHPWCPLCNVERPDDPGDLTIPADWT